MFHQMQYGLGCISDARHSNWCYDVSADRLQGSMVSSYPSQPTSRKHCREEADVAEWQAKRMQMETDSTRPTGGSALVVDILIKAAMAMAAGDRALASDVLAKLCGRISPHGDAAERVGMHFAKALAARMHATNQGGCHGLQPKGLPHEQKDRSEAYLALNKLTPFIRFAHLTANQAILEAVAEAEEIHIIDLDVAQGVQWPPLMQALKDRAGGAPRLLRITGIGSSTAALNQTGARLRDFALSLGVPFVFHALPGGIEALTRAASLRKKSDETMVINCMMQLHHLLEKDTATLRSVLQAVQRLSPEIVTVAEQQFGDSRRFNWHHRFLDTFSEALRHYSAIFESLDATLPPTSTERLSIEQSFLGKEIMELICFQDSVSMENYEQLSHWKELMARVGFKLAPHSKFATAQARLLLKLCYPADGYQLVEDAAGCLLLGWQDTPLFSVSAWKQHQLPEL